MVKKSSAFCITALLIMTFSLSSAFGEIAYKRDTPGQIALNEYLERVNANLAAEGEKQINSLFEMYDGFADLGITEKDNAVMPEDIEIHAELKPDRIDRVQVRVKDAGRFPRVAAAFVQAVSPNTVGLEEAKKKPTALISRVAAQPEASYEEPVSELNGDAPQVFYAYLPNQLGNNVNWYQLTVVFPLPGYENAAIIEGDTATKPPDAYGDNPEDYEGYSSKDRYSHLDVFTAAPPEPDSPAGDEMSREIKKEKAA